MSHETVALAVQTVSWVLLWIFLCLLSGKLDRIEEKIDALERLRTHPRPSGDTQVPPAADHESTT